MNVKIYGYERIPGEAPTVLVVDKLGC